MLSLVQPTDCALAKFVEETYGRRLEEAFSVRRSFRRRVRQLERSAVALFPRRPAWQAPHKQEQQ